jgi:hypothetical protein
MDQAMFNAWKESSGSAKLVVISVALILLGFGLCGISSIGPLENVSSGFLSTGVLIFWAGILGMILGVLWMLFRQR